MPASEPVEELRDRIEGLGQDEYPFLDDEYSSGTRVPCTDFIPFIAERLKESDLFSIKKLMREVLRANPGLGAGPSWIDKHVEAISQISFARYLGDLPKDVLYELQALFIIASKGGGGRQFWITEDTPQLIAWILCPFLPEWSDQMFELRRRANTFIEGMRQDASYWEEYPLYGEDDEKVGPIGEDEISSEIATLTPAARMHLLYAVSRLAPGDIWHERGGGVLSDLTTYEIRSMGINIPDTAQEIESTGLLVASDEEEAFMHFMTKDEMIEACEETGTDYRKSWRKAEILNELTDHSPEHLKAEMEERGVVTLNPSAEERLLELSRYADNLSTPCELLCFAPPIV
ncbi:hypothetical protein [Salinibacter ruber]|uniref:hypothetical protein n=1 Tax=Salinibacter ruber TaxID=146919 RepID=UPI0021674B70|nr:hypothetical protein [Salinibacter ruber]MCS4195932.1 hypothetical protein [Salinibacter ruber]